MGLTPLVKETPESLLYAAYGKGHVRTSQEENPYPKTNLARPQSGTSSLQNCEKQFLLFKPSSPGYIVMAVQAD